MIDSTEAVSRRIGTLTRDLRECLAQGEDTREGDAGGLVDQDGQRGTIESGEPSDGCDLLERRVRRSVGTRLAHGT